MVGRKGFGRAWRAYKAPSRPGGKYGAIRTEYNGIRYDSKLEARYAQALDNRWALPQNDPSRILWYVRQTGFSLEGGVVYRADFLVALPVAPYIQVIDATGVLTRVKLNKLKQVHARYGIVVLLYRRDGSLRPYFD